MVMQNFLVAQGVYPVHSSWRFQNLIKVPIFLPDILALLLTVRLGREKNYHFVTYPPSPVSSSRCKNLEVASQSSNLPDRHIRKNLGDFASVQANLQL